MEQQNENLLQLLEAIMTFTPRFSEFKVSDMKKSILSFTNIVIQRKDTEDLKAFISQSSGVVTKIFSELSKRFREVEPHYIQEFYCQWKEILRCIKASTRAKCCSRNISEMQVLVSHLRNATNRLEQISILTVLCLYTERVSLRKLNLVEDHLLSEIAQLPSLMMNPTQLHTFLGYVNVDGTNIFTIKAVEVTPVDFQFDYIKQKHQLWLDFNLKEQSITFVCLSAKTKKLLRFGIVPRPQVTYYLLNDAYQLIIEGCWTLDGGSDLTGTDRLSKIMFTCHADDNNRIDSLKSHFNLSEYGSFDVANAGRDKATEMESKIIPYHECNTESVLPNRPDPLLLNSEFSEFPDDNCNVATDWKWILDHEYEKDMFQKRKNGRVGETDGQPRKRARLGVEQSPLAESLIVEEQICAPMDQTLEWMSQQMHYRIERIEVRVESLTQKVQSLLDETTRNQRQL